MKKVPLIKFYLHTYAPNMACSTAIQEAARCEVAIEAIESRLESLIETMNTCNKALEVLHPHLQSLKKEVRSGK